LFAHAGGSDVLPTHSSQLSQGLEQAGTGVQGRHFSGSDSVAAVQVGVPAASVEPRNTAVAAPGTWQQPKQSQPLGTTGPQIVAHCAGCVCWSVAHEELVPGTGCFGSYAHCFPDGS
jgi:hypothetical protein